jgi:hypothetical protein
LTIAFLFQVKIAYHFILGERVERTDNRETPDEFRYHPNASKSSGSTYRTDCLRNAFLDLEASGCQTPSLFGQSVFG